MTPYNPRKRGAQPIPVIAFAEGEAEQAFQAFAALRKAAQADPALVENKYFQALQDTAYARFYMMFEVLP